MHRIITTILALVAAVALTVAAGCAVPAEPTAVQPAESGDAKSGKPAKKVTVKISAKRTGFEPKMLATGGAYSCVRVTVKNQRDGKNLNVNPLYFSLVDSNGEKHEVASALGDYEGQIAMNEIAPGEKVSGTVCAQGKFKPAIVAMTDELLSEQARAEVG